jgi:hypothetical protein
VQCLVAFFIFGPVIVALADGELNPIQELHIRALVHFRHLAGGKVLDIKAKGATGIDSERLAMDRMDQQAAVDNDGQWDAGMKVIATGM